MASLQITNRKSKIINPKSQTYGPFTFTETPLAGSYVIVPKPFEDERGWFFRNYSEDAFAALGLYTAWPQMNHSFTKTKGSIRGMHFQYPPHSEVKLVRCIAGVVQDVIVDLRQGSPTFLQWFGTELSAANRQMLYIPTGFAHGFQTLTNDCELLYQHSTIYQPGSEGGLRYNDERINIHWPLEVSVISERDIGHPLIEVGFAGVVLK